MSTGIIMILFFIFCIFVFALFAIFLPEWVGITGKDAQKNLKSHSSNEVEPNKNLENFLEGKD